MGVPARHLLAGVVALDALVAKATSPYQLALKLEARLKRVLHITFTRRALEGLDAAGQALEGGTGPMVAADADAYLHRLGMAFEGWTAEVGPLLEVILGEAYKASATVVYRRVAGGVSRAAAFDAPVPTEKAAPKAAGGKGLPKGSKVLEIKPSFDLKDQEAIKALKDGQLFWIGNLYKQQINDVVAGQVKKTMLDAGLGRREAAKALQATLLEKFGLGGTGPGTASATQAMVPSDFPGNTLQYLDVVAAAAVTTARTAGSLRTLPGMGVTHYEIVNPMDERTCVVCSFMAGRVFDVEHAVERLNDIAAAPNPEDVKKLHPWIPSAKPLYDAVAGKKPDDITGVLKKKGWSFPPYHGRCRCSVDITEGATFDLLTPEKPKEPEKPAFPWKPYELTKLDRRLGGAHTKSLFRAPDGSEWMFKPVEKGMEFRALGDEAAAELARLLGLDTAELYATELDTQFGSVQRMFTDVAGDFSATAPTALAAEQAAALEEQHVFDWLTSQHDTHSENALRMKDGKVRFIDKGQLFRFFGKDQLSLDYGGAGKPNPVETYYHKMFNAYANGGNVPIKGMKAIEPLLKRIEALPDEAFIKAIRPYAQAATQAAAQHPELMRAAWMGRYNEQEFIQAALARKNNLRKDFEAFYKDVEKRRAEALPKAAPKGSGTGHDWAGLQKDAKQAGWAGKSFFVAGNDFENMNWLLYDTEGDGVFMEARVREASDAKLKQFLSHSPALPTAKPMSVVVDNDPFHADMLKAFKSFNVHMGPKGDQIIPEHTKQLAETISAKLKEALNAPDGSLLDHQFWHYSSQWNSIYSVGEKKFKPTGLGKMFTKAPPFTQKVMVEDAKPLPSALPHIPGLPPGWKVERTRVGDTIGRALDHGKIRYDGEPHANYADKGDIFKFTTPQGHTIIYRPRQAYDEYMNPYSLNGNMRFHLNRPMAQLSPADLEAAFTELKDLGLETKASSLADFQALQLRKVAFKEKLDAAAWKAAPAKLPAEEQVTKLKAFLKSEGHKLPTTSPVPVYEHGKFGPPRFMSDHAGTADSSKFVLTHSLGTSDVATKLKQILEGGTNSLLSSAERLRIGIGGRAGMSPEQDMGTGGANFVYTRIRRKGSDVVGLHFKGELLNDLDSISYTNDMYGKQTETALKQRVTRNQWATTAHSSDNETLFKHSLSLDWLDSIVVGSQTQKATIEKLFADHGIKSLGGKPISALVRVQ